MTVTITRPVRRRPVFHPLAVAAVDRLTDDAVAITFAVPEELRETFAFSAGQHLTVRREGTDGAEVRRSYSICSTPAELARHGRLRIGVREIPGGAFSAFACGALRGGDTVEVLPPLGHFTTAFAPERVRHYGAVVAGSGITPVLSLVATALAVEPASTFTLVYGNRTANTVMFAEELADLKDRYPTRCTWCTCSPASRASRRCCRGGSTPSGWAGCWRPSCRATPSRSGSSAARTAWCWPPGSC